MTLVWAVPVVAAAVAAILVAVAARPVGDLVSALVDDVRSLRRVQDSLASVREAAADSEAAVAAFRRRHPGDEGAAAGEGDGEGAGAPDGVDHP